MNHSRQQEQEALVPALAQLEENGVLVDLMRPPFIKEVHGAGYTMRVAVARDVFELYVVGEEADAGGPGPCLRLWDILWMSRAAAGSGAPAGSIVPFEVGIAGHGEVTLLLSMRAAADGPYVLVDMPRRPRRG